MDRNGVRSNKRAVPPHPSCNPVTNTVEGTSHTTGSKWNPPSPSTTAQDMARDHNPGLGQVPPLLSLLR